MVPKSILLKYNIKEKITIFYELHENNICSLLIVEVLLISKTYIKLTPPKTTLAP